MRRVILIALLTISITGCASYRAPKGDDVATLNGQWRNVGITRVDGHRTTSEITFEGRNKVRLSPGKHTVQVRAMLGGYYATADLWFVAAPRGEYEATYRTNKDRVAFWIVDKSTRRIVGGIKGSDDEPPDPVELPADKKPETEMKSDTV